MRALPFILAAALAMAGCGRAAIETLAPGGDYNLYTASSTQTAQLVNVIDTRSHAVERSLPSGTPSPDWSHLYSVQGTTLIDLNPRTGTAQHTLELGGPYKLPFATLSGLPGGLSPNGRWLVLEAFDAPVIAPATATHFVLVDTSYAIAAKRIDLAGYFEFDAVSSDGQRIYMIQSLSNGTYHVRLFNVGQGLLDPTIIFDKTDGTSAMSGLKLSSVASRDGHWLYSLYLRKDKGAFIHALSLDGNLAFCLDLPGLGYASSESGFHWSLALNADGSRLYAANGVLGVVTEFDASNGVPNLLRTGQIPAPAQSAGLIQGVAAKGFGSNGVVVSPDGGTLVTIGTTGITWIDVATLGATGRKLSDWRVWSIALSPNGDNLYAVSDGGMIAEVSMTGKHAASTFAGGPGQPIAVIRVEAAQVP
jgi:hypothetical protein